MTARSWIPAVVAWVGLTLGGEGYASGQPSVKDPVEAALKGPNSASVQLALASRFDRANRCGPAVFHYRRYLALDPLARNRNKVRAAIRGCLVRMGVTPLDSKPRRDAGASFSVELPIGTVLAHPVKVSAGMFLMGGNPLDGSWVSRLCALGTPGCSVPAGELPLHRVTLSTYLIDRTEVTVGQWRQCVKAGKCPKLRAAGAAAQRAVAGVTWFEAQAYCRWQAGRLPTEAEWEKAARGPDVPVRIWPWGGIGSERCANLRRSGRASKLASVGRHACDVSYFGVLDMAGNVREWVADRYASTPAAARANTVLKDPRGPRTGSARVVKGGSFRTSQVQARVAARSGVGPGTRSDDLGFRCVRLLGAARKKTSPKFGPRSR